MGRAVGAQRGEVAQRVALEEVEELRWDHGGHRPKVNPTRLILWPMFAATRPPVPADKLRIGLILPTWTTTDVRWSEVLEIAGTAAAVGFDALYVSDHLLLPSNNAELKRRAGVDFPDDPDIELEGYMECFTVLAALAVAIPRLALGSFVASTGYRNPGLMAKMAVTIDDISDGRLVLGLGAGDSEGEHLTFGFPHEQRVGRFEESLQVIKKLFNVESPPADAPAGRGVRRGLERLAGLHGRRPGVGGLAAWDYRRRVSRARPRSEHARRDYSRARRHASLGLRAEAG